MEEQNGQQQTGRKPKNENNPKDFGIYSAILTQVRGKKLKVFATAS